MDVLGGHLLLCALGMAEVLDIRAAATSIVIVADVGHVLPVYMPEGDAPVGLHVEQNTAQRQSWTACHVPAKAPHALCGCA